MDYELAVLVSQVRFHDYLRYKGLEMAQGKKKLHCLALPKEYRNK